MTNSTGLRENPRVLCACTIGNPPFAQLVALASQSGFSGLSLWRPYLEEQLSAGLDLNGMCTLLDRHGVAVDQVEAVMEWSRGDRSESEVEEETQSVLALARALGARRVLAVNMEAAAILPQALLRQRFRQLCERAGAAGLSIALEFLPWSGIADLDQALELVEAAPAGEGHGLMLDSWHVFRAGVSLSAIASLSGESIAGVQWNDLRTPGAPATLESTLEDRVLPGAGCADLEGLATALARTGTRAPQAIEVMAVNPPPSDPAAAAAAAAAALERLLVSH